MLLNCIDPPAPGFSVARVGPDPSACQTISGRIVARDPRLTVADPKGEQTRLGIAQFYSIYLFILLVVGLRVSQPQLST